MKKDIISQKGLFERLIRLETKLNMISKKSSTSDAKFTKIALLFIGLETVNMIFNYILFLRK